MGNYDPKKARIWQEIHSILSQDWDPFGDYPDSKDEYDAYIHPIYEMLKSGANQGSLCDYLEIIARKELCLVPLEGCSQKAAVKLHKINLES